ncbi:mediator of RNA polymerase II transcription subunit 15 isoform X2 [Cimex lectularius]|uniref:Mediator of RNA polymerase II transcription subunit 15 n=1 Tax=Cimex lectularius TaxID=79782 RepID=A0A8I6S6C0_CIMLE|nr:mediator of RNA polymerase II transcription subunit 15 isoform X2 [Cimex lectularius]
MSITEEWRTPAFRQSVVNKLDEAIQRSGMTTSKSGIEMESHVFQKSKTKEEYLGLVARLIFHVREVRSGNQNMGQGLPPPVPQQNNPNMMQGMNSRPVLQQKLQPSVQGGVMMTGLGGAMGPGAGGSPLSAGIGLQTMQGRRPDVNMGVPAGGFVGPRGVNASPYLRQSPTPPITSPVQQNVTMQPGQMGVPSPALVPSPSNPQLVGGTAMQATMQRPLSMASSPSSACLNTPGQPNASPCSLQEDAAYREKIRQLSKYVEPLRRMISRFGSDCPSNIEKLSKMKTLLELLANPNKRVPLETLLKCEVVLEKVDGKRGVEPVREREQHPLLEALKNHLQSPFINHSLQRTFGPTIEALFGSDIRNVPPSLKRRKIEEPNDDIPEVLQGEIARLDQRFKVSLDPTGGTGGSIQLICWLDDKHLPCVPPIALSVPEDYPSSPPECHLAEHEHSATPFLESVKTALSSRVSKLSSKFTVSQLLDAWEMSVRQACAPSVPAPAPSSSTALLVNS